MVLLLFCGNWKISKNQQFEKKDVLVLTWCGKSQGSAGGCGWTVWDGRGRRTRSRERAMLLWMLLLFCENGKLKKFQKFQNSKTEKKQKSIGNDSQMEGSKEAVGWRRIMQEEGDNSVEQDKVDDGVDVVVVGILGTKKEPCAALVSQKIR